MWVYNATEDFDKVACVYPISGQYGLIPRLLFYALLMFAILSRGQPWLVVGATASAATYSGTAAIHALVLAASSSNPVFDLDGVGVWAIVSVSCLAIKPVLEWSTTSLHSPHRPIIGFWGSLMSIGTMCSGAVLLRVYPIEASCRASSGQLLIQPNQILNSQFNCTYTCFSTHHPLRNPSDMTIIFDKRAFGKTYGDLLVIIVMVLIFGALLSVCTCLPGPRKSSEEKLRKIIASDAPDRLELPKISRIKRQIRIQASRELATGEVQPERSPYAFIAIPLLFATIVINELFLLEGGGLPTSEAPYAIGQWAPLVGVSLVLIAAGINKYNGDGDPTEIPRHLPEVADPGDDSKGVDGPITTAGAGATEV